MQAGGALEIGFQYLVQPYYYPAVNLDTVNGSAPVNWTIVVNIDTDLFFPTSNLVYNVGLPILGAALAALTMVVAAILVVSLTRPLRRVARQLNAVARLRLRSIRRRHAHMRARQGATSDSDTDVTESTTWVRIGQTKAAGGWVLMSFGFSYPLRPLRPAVECSPPSGRAMPTGTCATSRRSRGGAAPCGRGHRPRAGAVPVSDLKSRSGKSPYAERGREQQGAGRSCKR